MDGSQETCHTIAGMSASEIGRSAGFGRNNAGISRAGAQFPLKLNPSVPLCGIPVFAAASAVSFGHHP